MNRTVSARANRYSRVTADTVGPDSVAAAVEVTPRRLAGERHAEAGVPDPQLARAQAVVGEQEIPHRVGLARLRPVRLQELTDSLAVCVFAALPR